MCTDKDSNLINDFICLLVNQVVHYLHPLEPSIGEGMHHNLSQWIA